jgi:hypothetical protein
VSAQSAISRLEPLVALGIQDTGLQDLYQLPAARAAGSKNSVPYLFPCRERAILYLNETVLLRYNAMHG